MSEAVIREAIKTLVEAVSRVGVVHDYERWAADWSGFLGHFKTTISGTAMVRGWTITCQGFTQEEVTFEDSTLTNRGLIDRIYTYKIRGYFGLDDSAASEKTAIGIAEDVVEAFDGGIGAGVGVDNDSADLTVFEPRVFGDVLCHYAEITVMVTEFRDE